MSWDEAISGDEKGNKDKDEPWSKVLKEIRESENRTERRLVAEM